MLQLASNQQHIHVAPRGVLCPAYSLLNLLPSPQYDVVRDLHTVNIPMSTLMKPGCGQDHQRAFFRACSSLLDLRGAPRFWKQQAAGRYLRDAEVAVSDFNALNNKHKEHPLDNTIGS